VQRQLFDWRKKFGEIMPGGQFHQHTLEAFLCKQYGFLANKHDSLKMCYVYNHTCNYNESLISKIKSKIGQRVNWSIRPRVCLRNKLALLRLFALYLTKLDLPTLTEGCSTAAMARRSASSSRRDRI